MIHIDPFENEWKTQPFAEKFLQQLQLEPKVTLYSANAHKSFEKNNTDRNVPDLSNIATSLECLSHEDIYLDKTTDHTYTKKVDKHDLQIEEELSKMFDDVSPAKCFPEINKVVRKTKKQEKRLNNRLIELFGSSLKDVGIKKNKSLVPKKILSKRRHTLPISINISDKEILKPLQKRKSEADVNATAAKIIKIEDVTHSKIQVQEIGQPISKVQEIKTKFCKIQVLESLIKTPKSDELPSVNFTTVPNLLIPTIFTDIAKEIFTEDFILATVNDNPVVDMSETAATCIDLTNDETFDDGTSVKVFNGIRVEIRNDIKTEDTGASESSEQANVPVSNASVSMPLLSPASPAKPTQGEAVLPQGTTPAQPEGSDVSDSAQKPPPMKKQRRQSKTQYKQLKFKVHDTPKQQEPSPTERLLQQHQLQQNGDPLRNLTQMAGFVPQQTTFPMNLTVNQQNVNRTQNNFMNSFTTNLFEKQSQTQGNWYGSLHTNFQSPPNVNVNQSTPRRILPASTQIQNPIAAFEASIGHQPQKSTFLAESHSSSLTQQRIMGYQKTSSQQQTHSMFLQNQQMLMSQNALQSQQVQKLQQSQQQQMLMSQNAQQAHKLQQSQQMLMSQNAQQAQKLQQSEQMLMSQNVHQAQHAQKLQQRRVSSSRQQQTSSQALDKQQLPNYLSQNQQLSYLQSINSTLATNQSKQIWSQYLATYLQEQKQQQSTSVSNQQQQLSTSLQNQKSASASNFNPNLGRQTIVSPPYSQTSLNQCTPQLLRLLKCSNPNSDYYPISNSVCADKIFPHVNNFTKYVDSVNIFARSTVGLFTESELKMERESFGEYIKNTMLVLGKRMIRDLSTVTVVHFDIQEILKSLSSKLTDLNIGQVITVHRVCFLLHKLLGQADEFCTTPFLKKFLSIIRVCHQKFQETRPIVAITSEQLRTLALQVTQYRSINTWLIMNKDKQQQQQNQAQNKTTTSNTNQTEQSKSDESINQLFSQISNFLETGNTTNCDKRSDRVENNNTLSNTATVLQVTSGSDTNNTVPETTNNDTVLEGNQVDIERTIQRIENPVPSTVDTAESSRSTPGSSPTITSTTEDSGVISIDDEDSMDRAIKREVQIKKENVKEESRIEIGDDVIDLTWIENCTDGNNDILEEIIEYKPFSLKVEGNGTEENEEEELVVVREVISPADSGLGSPTAQSNDDYKCLCGNRAVYICRCNTSMYCSSDCQSKDWIDHQKLCHRQQT